MYADTHTHIPAAPAPQGTDQEMKGEAFHLKWS